MNKQELVKSMADKAGLSVKDAGAALDALVDTVYETVAKDESIALTGFATISVQEKKERTSRNPRTGEQIVIPAGKQVKVKVGSKLKNSVK